MLLSRDTRVAAIILPACAAAAALAGCGLVVASGYRDEVSVARREAATPAPADAREPGTRSEGSPGPAETGPLAIGVIDAVLLALERNPGFALERLAPSRAATFEEELVAAFDPAVTADFADARSDSSAGTGSLSKTRSASVGASVALPTGTQIELEADHGTSNAGVAPDTDDARV
ncbi:MAG: hypothetical protein ACYS9X_30895, partial [Planctomycetota bacterium]